MSASLVSDVWSLLDNRTDVQNLIAELIGARSLAHVASSTDTDDTHDPPHSTRQLLLRLKIILDHHLSYHSQRGDPAANAPDSLLHRGFAFQVTIYILDIGTQLSICDEYALDRWLVLADFIAVFRLLCLHPSPLGLHQSEMLRQRVAKLSALWHRQQSLLPLEDLTLNRLVPQTLAEIQTLKERCTIKKFGCTNFNPNRLSPSDPSLDSRPDANSSFKSGIQAILHTLLLRDESLVGLAWTLHDISWMLIEATIRRTFRVAPGLFDTVQPTLDSLDDRAILFDYFVTETIGRLGSDAQFLFPPSFITSIPIKQIVDREINGLTRYMVARDQSLPEQYHGLVAREPQTIVQVLEEQVSNIESGNRIINDAIVSSPTTDEMFPLTSSTAQRTMSPPHFRQQNQMKDEALPSTTARLSSHQYRESESFEYEQPRVSNGMIRPKGCSDHLPQEPVAPQAQRPHSIQLVYHPQPPHNVDHSPASTRGEYHSLGSPISPFTRTNQHPPIEEEQNGFLQAQWNGGRNTASPQNYIRQDNLTFNTSQSNPSMTPFQHQGWLMPSYPPRTPDQYLAPGQPTHPPQPPTPAQSDRDTWGYSNAPLQPASRHPSIDSSSGASSKKKTGRFPGFSFSRDKKTSPGSESKRSSTSEKPSPVIIPSNLSFCFTITGDTLLLWEGWSTKHIVKLPHPFNDGMRLSLYSSSLTQSNVTEDSKLSVRLVEGGNKLVAAVVLEGKKWKLVYFDHQGLRRDKELPISTNVVPSALAVSRDDSKIAISCRYTVLLYDISQGEAKLIDRPAAHSGYQPRDDEKDGKTRWLQKINFSIDATFLVVATQELLKDKVTGKYPVYVSLWRWAPATDQASTTPIVRLQVELDPVYIDSLGYGDDSGRLSSIFCYIDNTNNRDTPDPRTSKIFLAAHSTKAYYSTLALNGTGGHRAFAHKEKRVDAAAQAPGDPYSAYGSGSHFMFKNGSQDLCWMDIRTNSVFTLTSFSKELAGLKVAVSFPREWRALVFWQTKNGDLVMKEFEVLSSEGRLQQEPKGGQKLNEVYHRLTS
ncbi:hypothetical protein B0T17DRAFT_651451 [Bombardia bombarda]|uniref:Uncharacterized protein n=1 Tax=Bombardia bombarda TaxID=252184 RepID=A0AA39XNX0_9PEZI|nr:hypothetical protein B0T17DRAFT_651451 [Bombardia bombarda]